MIEVIGQQNKALCFTNNLEASAKEQIEELCNRPEFTQSKIRIMPDVHAGMGCTIGTTMTITDKVVPGIVGVDIGCGMETVALQETTVDLEKLDVVIHREIPSGRNIRTTHHALNSEIDLGQLRCSPYVNLERARRSIGTLGGGNHFIELAQGDGLYLVIHSGSRHIGAEVAKYYQDEGLRALCGNARHQIDLLIAEMKAQGRESEIQKTVKKLKKQIPLTADMPRHLTYVEGKLLEDYLHDMKIIQRYATLNRKAMVDAILQGLGLTCVDSFTTIHNYIDTENMILRKGAVSAQKGEKLLIPINMRDGSLICVGKGNEEWNCSAPHGAGRLMSRKTALDTLSLTDYRQQMAGIYSTCIVPETLDEAPMAYKSMDEIVSQIEPTAQILKQIKPIYNFKATE